MNRFLLLIVLLATFSAALSAQNQHKKLLFLGNSYTYYNSLPNLLQQLANNRGDTITQNSNAIGGYTFQGHSTNATSLNLIKQGGWDFVVLQEQSQLPSFPPSQVQTDVYPYAALLNDSIEKYNPCGQTLFFMTWGRKNGDAGNCPGYPQICTYYGMQERLRQSYLEMTTDNNAVCSPVGAAWNLVRDSFPGIELYVADGSHPSYAGSYLAATVFYAVVFRKSPVGISFYGTLPDTVAQQLQWAAERVAVDSLQLWSVEDYDVQADFTATTGDGWADFANTSSHANQYFWDFGDGNTSTEINPTHIYNLGGAYPVQLIAMDSCGVSDTLLQSVTVVLSATNSLQPENNTVQCYPNPTKDGTIFVTSTQPIQSVRAWDSLGRLVISSKTLDIQQTSLFFAQSGWYVIEVNANGIITNTKVVVE